MALLKVGFTGTRDGMTPAQMETFRKFLLEHMNTFGHDQYSEFHHGDAVGADEEARSIAKKLGFKIHRHPPTNPAARAYTDYDVDYEELPYRDRNRKIVSLTDFLYACPKGSSCPTNLGGTWYTYRHAIEQGSYKRAMLIYPDGTPFYDKVKWYSPLQ